MGNQGEGRFGGKLIVRELNAIGDRVAAQAGLVSLDGLKNTNKNYHLSGIISSCIPSISRDENQNIPRIHLR